MLGLELIALDDAGPFFRAAGRQGVLSLLIASYLMRYHAIRLVAPLATMLPGNPGRRRVSVLRIQPPASLTQAEIEHFLAALAEVLSVIDCNNEYLLVGHLSGHRVNDAERTAPSRFDAAWPLHQHDGEIDARTGFVAHPTRLEHLVAYYFPSFEHYGWDADRLRDWWNRLSPFLEPQHTRSSHIHSNGFVVENNLIFVPYLPEYLTADHPPRVRQAIQDKIQDAVTVAKELGDDNIPTAVVGLGAYTSIVTNNGQTINDYEVPVTTGNAFTATLVLEGLAQAAVERGVDLATSTVAVIGAGGNIGQVLAQILAAHVGRLILVARPGDKGVFKLRMARRAVIEELLRAWRDPADTVQGGELATALHDCLAAAGECRWLDPATDLRPAARRIERLMEAWFDDGDNPWFGLATDMDAIAQADLIAVATNSSNPELLRPEQVKPGAIVCCASVPSNLSRRFADSGHFAFDGGLARLPEGSTVEMVGMPTDGLAFGCLAETLVLGFDGLNQSFSKGLLTPTHIHRVAEMSDRHGFTLGDYQFIGGKHHAA
jgi:predicted amino acid dehydrogenase